ncbi:SLAP domain-containing protein [uncultured Lactobacillus sp.]|uniref:SLAP domain-containing protein n=1 Tax=uncultured Lactobacillus sp. TaxID=153152 RepID=UPI00260AF869|nr:SLAP domain-containing protein [uncultured Lactobacillus sp.]
MKYTKLLAAGLAVLSLDATAPNIVNAASDTTSSFTKSNGIANILTSEGARIYSAPGQNPTQRVLPVYSNWKVLGYTTVNGVKWFNVGKNQWINSQQTKYTESSNPTGTYYYGSKNATGVVKVHYKPGYGIAVWSQPGKGVIPGKYLKHGTSWKYFQTANVGGLLWYNLGGNQWVSAQYTTSDNPYGVAKYAFDYKSIVKITNPKGAKIYSDPNSGVTTGHVLPAASRWKTFEVLNNGDRWYNLGGNQWIMQEDTWG